MLMSATNYDTVDGMYSLLDLGFSDIRVLEAGVGNDNARSLRVGAGIRLTLHEKGDGTGVSSDFTSDAPNTFAHTIRYRTSAATLVDIGTPTIDCPDNVVVPNDVDQCSASVGYTEPVGEDNCPDPTTLRTAGDAPNAIFNVGTATITFQVTDKANLIGRFF
jgi:hypothetical protein